ncbi:MAG: tetratricopeptide repeat protein [Acidobacteria bacterium]|nr:tetratricopeptide repeat protein [Acidobacteriota bacterium]
MSLREQAMELAGDGQLHGALTAMIGAIALEPERMEWRRDLAAICGAKGEWAEAARLYQQAAPLAGADTYDDWGRALIESGDAERGLDVLEQVRVRWPARPRTLYLLARAYSNLSRGQEAVNALIDCLALDPDFAPAQLLLAQLLMRGGYYFGARDALLEYARLRPGGLTGRSGLVRALWHTGELAACRGVCESLIAEGCASPFLESLYRVIRIHTPGETAESLRSVHESWNAAARTVPASPGATNRQPDPERRLRIGYIANQLAKGPFFHFVTPLLRDRDRENFSVYCYHTSGVQDDYEKTLRGHADHWRGKMEMEELAAQVEADRIDILVDLSGHYGTHLPLFQEKRAPVQLALPTEYPATTGVPGIDYILTDRLTCAAGQDEQYTERPCFLPGGYLTYQPPAPVPIPPPSVGPITFGLFQRPAKCNDAVLRALRQILLAVPDSRLLVHYAATELDDAGSAAQRRFLDAFGGRVRFRGGAPLVEHLGILAEADIALDTFPYNGQTTTCECLWMGVPVVTLAGDVHTSRVGCAILSRAGLDELVADTVDGYVTRAAALASDRARLHGMRSELREWLSRSPMVNGDAVRGIERAMRALWREWCTNQKERERGRR